MPDFPGRCLPPDAQDERPLSHFMPGPPTPPPTPGIPCLSACGLLFWLCVAWWRSPSPGSYLGRGVWLARPAPFPFPVLHADASFVDGDLRKKVGHLAPGKQAARWQNGCGFVLCIRGQAFYDFAVVKPEHLAHGASGAAWVRAEVRTPAPAPSFRAGSVPWTAWSAGRAERRSRRRRRGRCPRWPRPLNHRRSGPGAPPRWPW